jgi:glycerate kinase
MASNTLLVASGHFTGKLDAASVVGAIEQGLRARGDWEIDESTLTQEGDPGAVRALLDALNFDARMRAAHAVVVVEEHLDRSVLRGSAVFEIATRARQAGVPCYAVAVNSELDPFEARILDLQLVIEATSTRSFAAAGRLLGKLI